MEEYTLRCWEQRNKYVWEGSQRMPHRSLEAEESGESSIELLNEKEENVLDIRLGKGIEYILEPIIRHVGEWYSQDLYLRSWN